MVESSMYSWVHPILRSHILLASVSLAAITVNPSCGEQKTTSVNEALTEALAIAQNVVDNGSQTDPRALNLFRALFGFDSQYYGVARGQLALPDIKFGASCLANDFLIDNIGLVTRFVQIPPAVTIYCGDTFIQQQPAGPNMNQWWDTRDANNSILVASVTGSFQSCASNGFLGYALLPGVIVLCDKAFGRGASGADTIGPLRTQYLPG